MFRDDGLHVDVDFMTFVANFDMRRRITGAQNRGSPSLFWVGSRQKKGALALVTDAKEGRKLHF